MAVDIVIINVENRTFVDRKKRTNIRVRKKEKDKAKYKNNIREREKKRERKRKEEQVDAWAVYTCIFHTFTMVSISSITHIRSFYSK